MASNPQYDGYQGELPSIVCKFFLKKSRDTSTHTGEHEISEEHELVIELHSPITKKFKKHKIYSSFRDDIWSPDLADVQLISKYNKGIRS